MASSAVSETQKVLPLSYRKNLVSAIMECIRAGESCSLIGVASVGKSNLFRFLIRPDVRQHYLGESWERFLFVFVDYNMLAEASEWGVFELFLHRILESVEDLEGSEVPSELIGHLEDLYQRVVTSGNRLLAQRYLSRCLGTLVKKGDFRFVFFLDEFDPLFEQLDGRFFLNLRGLRDEYKYRVSHISATRRLLPQIREDMRAELESFYEFLSCNVFPLTPYDRDDARAMVGRLMVRRQVVLNEEVVECLLTASGGHSGLLRASFELACDKRSSGVLAVPKQMLENYSIELECRKIWDSLTKEEREVLSFFATGQQATCDQAIVEYLKLKGVLVEDEAGERLFSPILAQFVLQELTA
jgi:hypothetical protein